MMGIGAVAHGSHAAAGNGAVDREKERIFLVILETITGEELAGDRHVDVVADLHGIDFAFLGPGPDCKAAEKSG